MNRLTRGLLVLMLAAPVSALAQPSYEGGDRYDTSVWGEPVADVDVFYDRLAPYGVWVDEPSFGRVFIPDRDGFVPYTEGHWQYTTIGFVWISADPFAWATVHYGRWIYSRAFRRWAWRPDTVWGPSWVEWRVSGDYFGWAPLAPTITIEIGYAPPIESWHYCAAAHLVDTNVSRYYEPQRRVIEIHRDARTVGSFANIGGARVVVGPSEATLRERKLELRPAKIDARATGRWSPVEVRDAVKHAQDHRTTNDELNHKRLDNNPRLRDAQKQVVPPAKQPQVRQEPRSPEVRQPAQPPRADQAKQVQPRPPQSEQPKRPQQQPQQPKQPQVQPQPRPPQSEQPKRPQQAPQQPKQPQAQPRPPQNEQPKAQPQPKQPQAQPQPPQGKQPAPDRKQRD